MSIQCDLKYVKAVVTAALTLLFATTAHGQYSFRVSVSYGGICSGHRELAQKEAEARAGHINQLTFSTQAECESVRSSLVYSTNVGLDGVLREAVGLQDGGSFLVPFRRGVEQAERVERQRGI